MLAAWREDRDLDGSGSALPVQDETLPVYSATTPDLTLQPAAPPFDGPLLSPLTFNPIPASARWPTAAAPGPAPPGLPGGAQAYLNRKVRCVPQWGYLPRFFGAGDRDQCSCLFQGYEVKGP